MSRPPTLENITTTTNNITILSWNIQQIYALDSLFTTISKHHATIVFLQEPPTSITDTTDIKHTNFLAKCKAHGFTPSITSHTISLFHTTNLLQHATLTTHTISAGRVQLHTLCTTDSDPYLLLNIYAHQPAAKYNSARPVLIHQLTQALATHCTTTELKDNTFFAFGDFNVPLTSSPRLKHNLLDFLINNHNMMSILPILDTNKQHYTRTQSGNRTAIDHILVPKRYHKDNFSDFHASVDHTIGPTLLSADHHPTLLTLPITYTAHHTNLDETIPHPAYHKISSIPMRLQPPPPDDPNAPAWFVVDQPNHITDKQHQTHTHLLSRIDHAHNYPAVQDIIPTLESALTSLEDQVIASTSTLNLHDNPYHTIPRTKHLRHQIDEIYDKIERGINLTLDIANIHQTKTHPPRISPTTHLTSDTDHYDALAALHSDFQRCKSKFNALSDHFRCSNHEHLGASITSYSLAVHNLHLHTNQALTTVQTLLTGLAEHEADIAQRHSKKNHYSPTNPPDPTDLPDDPLLHTTRDPSGLTKTLKQVLTHIASINKATQSLPNPDDDTTHSAATTTTPPLTHDQYKHILSSIQAKHATISSLLNKASGNANIPSINHYVATHTPGLACQALKPTHHAPSIAETHYKTRTKCHEQPRLTPALGRQAQLHATKLNQSDYMDNPAGKNLHYMDTTRDEAGPNGASLHLNRTFTHANLDRYLPESSSKLDSTIQQNIVDAHHSFQRLCQSHQKNTNPLFAWPYHYRTTHPHTGPNTAPHSKPTHPLHAPIPNLIDSIGAVPSKVRYHNYTLNILARLPIIWYKSLQRLIPIILATRLMPRGAKQCGRSLIPKANSTDRRPISLLHDLDAFLDIHLSKQLSILLEANESFPDTVKAYRPGHSCTDITLSHLAALEDVQQHRHTILAQLDEDKEKFFDHITLELQLLPFILEGFPPKGFLEFLTESLSGLTIHIRTQHGTVTAPFLCGIKQGSAFSCLIANMVVTLCAKCWTLPSTSPEPPASPHAPQAYTFAPDIMTPLTKPPLLDHTVYCDDASKYLSHTNMLTLQHDIQRNLDASGHFSIVTKLGINAGKSTIRILNAPPNMPKCTFYYTAYTNLDRSITRRPLTCIIITSSDLTAHSTPHRTAIKPYRTFGTHTNLLADLKATGTKTKQALAYNTHLVLKPGISAPASRIVYSALALSSGTFNPLATTYSIPDAIALDTTAHQKLSAKFNLLDSDYSHHIYLPTSHLGLAFPSHFVATAHAKLRELTVSTNTANPHQPSPLATMLSTRIHSILHTRHTTSANFLAPHITDLTGLDFHLCDLDMPVLTMMRLIAAELDPNIHPHSPSRTHAPGTRSPHPFHHLHNPTALRPHGYGQYYHLLFLHFLRDRTPPAAPTAPPHPSHPTTFQTACKMVISCFGFTGMKPRKFVILAKSARFQKGGALKFPILVEFIGLLIPVKPKHEITILQAV